ncbi:MAG: sugar kinase [Brachybacterium sp.]|nr:sugar kinase [Brachybacterium sp.]
MTSLPGSAPEVVTLGETMAMMRSGRVGSLAHLPEVEISLGGAESNVAVGLRRLGVEVAWIGRVGDDDLGERVAREIRAEGVIAHAVVDPERPTGLMIKSHPTSRSTRVAYYRSGSAGSALAPEDVPAGLIEGARLLHLTGITPMLSTTAARSAREAAERAAAAGTLVSVDINYRSALGPPERCAELLQPVLAHADLVFGGPEELALLAPTTDPQDHDALLEAASEDGTRDVVLKLGADGARVRARGGQEAQAPAVPVDVVDTVGAGDAFVAGYLSALLEGADLVSCLERGALCGAAACSTPGDWEGAPRRRDLERSSSAASTDPVDR